MQLVPRFLYDDEDDVVDAGQMREITLRPAPILERLLESAGSWLRRCLVLARKKPPLMITEHPHWPLPPANPGKRSRESTEPKSETEHLLPSLERPVPGEPAANLPPPREAKRLRDRGGAEEWDCRCTGGRTVQGPLSEAFRNTVGRRCPAFNRG